MQNESENNNLDDRPSFIKNNTVGIGEIEYNGRKILYSILQKDLVPSLPGFLWYPNGEHLFISEEVPEKFRDPQLIHEIIEFSELKDQTWRCLMALKAELEMLQQNIRQEYLAYRKDFFARLVEFQKDNENEDFKAEIQASHDFLQNLE